MKNKNKKRKKSNLPFILLFIIGFLILLYPQVSRLYYSVKSMNNVGVFDSEKNKLGEEEINRRMELAQAFNASLINDITEDPYSDDKKEEGKKEYARMLEIHEQIGHIKIPRINVDLPTYAGTSEDVLQKGAGHLEGTSLPIGGNSSHSVITAHSGLPTAKLFTDLSKVKMGDKFYFHNFKEVIAYQVDQIKIVEPDNFEDLLIVPGHDYMTLLTCTPIMINSHRLLVRGHRVEYIPLEEQKLSENSIKEILIKYAFYLAIILILILIFLNIHFVKKKNKYNQEYLKIKNQKNSNEDIGK